MMGLSMECNRNQLVFYGPSSRRRVLERDLCSTHLHVQLFLLFSQERAVRPGYWRASAEV